MLKILIVDVHGCKDRAGIEYVGRRGQHHTWPASVLANPYTFKRDGIHALDYYAAHLSLAIWHGGDIQRGRLLELERLLDIARTETGLKLGCWCVNDANPLAHTETVCHAQIIARKLAEIEAKNGQKLEIDDTARIAAAQLRELALVERYLRQERKRLAALVRKWQADKMPETQIVYFLLQELERGRDVD